MTPKLGDIVLIDERASVQFSDNRRLVIRVIRVSDKPTYHGWAWITGYVLDHSGDAPERREVFVQLAGLRLVPPWRTYVDGRKPDIPGRHVKLRSAAAAGGRRRRG